MLVLARSKSSANRLSPGALELDELDELDSLELLELLELLDSLELDELDSLELLELLDSLELLELLDAPAQLASVADCASPRLIVRLSMTTVAPLSVRRATKELAEPSDEVTLTTLFGCSVETSRLSRREAPPCGELAWPVLLLST